MREIKFRGWNKKTKVMIDPHKLTPLALNSDCKDLKGLFLPFHEDVELMQFTGLHDKNGKEIWEGDIVQKDCGMNRLANGKVVFEHGAFCIQWIGYPTEGLAFFEEQHPEWFEVIGDIYSNPELLGEKCPHNGSTMTHSNGNIKCFSCHEIIWKRRE